MPARPIDQASSDPIDAACTARGARKFYDALGEVVTLWHDVRKDRLPHDLLMLDVLCYFLLDVDFWRKEHSGMERFLAYGEHGLAVYAADAAQFCAAIGATRTADHFARSFAVLPRKRMPKTLNEIQLAIARLPDPSPLVAIEREHGDTFRELNTVLQRWLRANRHAVRAQVDALVGAAATPVPRSDDRRGSASALDAQLASAGAPGTVAPYDILADLVGWVWATPGRTSVPFAELPQGARTIILLESLARALGTGGSAYLAEWDVFDPFAEVRAAAAACGATTSVRYLDAYAALFPRGRVPANRDARVDAMERVEAKAAKRGEASPFETLDADLAEAAMAELPGRVRDHVRLNRDRFDAESLAAAAQPPGSSPDDLLLDEEDWVASKRRRLAQYGEQAFTDDLPPSERARVGDVIEMKSRKGFAYCQVTHLHPYAGLIGPVIRAIGGVVPERLEGRALAAHVAGPTAFVALVPVDEARGARKMKLAGRALPVPPEHAAFPHFLYHTGKTRDGTRNVWGEWAGGDVAVGRHVGPLDAALLALPICNIGTPPWEDLGKSIASGWTHADEYAEYGEGKARR